MFAGMIVVFCADRHIGDLGNVIADERGVAKIEISDTMLELSGPHCVIGRTIVVRCRC